MTIQEKAIEQLERISEHLSAIGEKEDYTDIAINALGKDIPKEPIQPKDKVRYGMGYSYYDYYCPTCEDYQFPEPKGNELKEEGHITRCFNCGQLIKWENKADDE